MYFSTKCITKPKVKTNRNFSLLLYRSVFYAERTREREREREREGEREIAGKGTMVRM